VTVPARLPLPLTLAARIWAVTLGLVAAALLAVAAVVHTGGPLPVAGVGLVALGGLAVASYRSGGRFEFDSADARPLEPGELPTVRRALLSACDAAGRPPPRLVAMEMDVPGAMVGYESGRPVVAVDPLLPRVLGPAGLEAVFAHELGHLGTDLHTDALRQYAPQVLGFGAFWLVALAGRGPAVATLGSVAFGALSLSRRGWPVRLRYALGLGVEPLALAVSRYSNRLEELRADEFAAGVVAPSALGDALYRVAAVATGDNLEDVAGPVPWEADRSLLFRLFATHPSVEHRVTRLGCELPDWVRPYQPHREEPSPAGKRG
jgi:Zn-dependent protease with chaperone function